MLPSTQRQQGVALLTAVMVVALASTLVAGLMVTQNLSIHRAANMRSIDAAWWYLVGLEEWAGTILRRDAEANQVDNLNEPWAQTIDFLPVDEGVLSGQLVDLNGRFNLNSLGKPLNQNPNQAPGTPAPAEEMEIFNRLLQAIPELRNQPIADLGSKIADWVDADANPRFPGGAEDETYMGMTPPRRAANQLLTSVTELRAIAGVTPEIYAALLPHVAVLPTTNLSINVNTATPAVLQSLAAGVSPAEIEGLLVQRQNQPWEDAQAFSAEPAFAGRALASGLSVTSEWFEARGTADIDGVRLELVSRIQRGSDNKARVVARSRAPL